MDNIMMFSWWGFWIIFFGHKMWCFVKEAMTDKPDEPWL